MYIVMFINFTNTKVFKMLVTDNSLWFLKVTLAIKTSLLLNITFCVV